MTFPPLTPLVRTAGQLQGFALTVLPHGGQRSARRNAWSAMSVDAAFARSRREAEHAMSSAVARSRQASARTS
ncbi:MAG TPA: hypothetical protein VM097_05180 [Mycobacteriales bacterium]|nr:hypothetical protein [Mycobacteriales bacterium]